MTWLAASVFSQRLGRWVSGVSLLLLAATAVLLGTGPGGPATVEAAAPTRLAMMIVSVMPEYNQPRIVVQMQGRVSEPAPPADLRLSLPAKAQVTHACFLNKPVDEHVCRPFGVEPAGGSEVLTFQVPGADFFVEYAYGYVERSGQRSFDFVFLPPYATDRLEVSVQEPLRSRDFAVSPEGSTRATEPDGFRYYDYTYQNASPDQPVVLEFSYTKDDLRPSVNPSPSEDPNRTAQTSKNLIYALVLGGSIFAVVVMVLSHRRKPGVVSPAEPADDEDGGDLPPAHFPAAAIGGSARFCQHCGAALSGPGRFCPSCGVTLAGARSTTP